jgi:hypothetical protein
MDVKSLFKSGKKTIKAFKISTGPAADAPADSKPTEGPLEAWEAPAVAQPVPTVSINVDVEEYKAQEAAVAAKPCTSWSAEEPKTVEEPELKPTTSSYVPPSQRRAETARAMPSLAEAVQGIPSAARPTPIPLRTASVSSAAPATAGPPRLKLITASAKKAQEEEEKRKEEEKKQKEAEKQARKEALRAELERTTGAKSQEEVTVTGSASGEIKAAPLDKIYAKYVGRAKIGRKLAVVAA